MQVGKSPHDKMIVIEVEDSGRRLRSFESLSHPPLDEKVDDPGWCCTLILFSALSEDSHGGPWPFQMAQTILFLNSELLGSALYITCTKVTETAWLKAPLSPLIFILFTCPIFCINFISFFPALGFSVLVSTVLFLAEWGESCTPVDRVWNRSWWKWKEVTCFNVPIF